MTCHSNDSEIDTSKLLYCKICIKAELYKRDDLCPINNHKNPSYKESSKSKEINQLIVKCKFYGCEWVDKLIFLKNHLKNCECKLNLYDYFG